MKARFTFPVYILLSLILVLIGIASCEDKEPEIIIPEPVIVTDSYSDLTFNGVVIHSNLQDDDGAAIISRGVVWGTKASPTLSYNAGYTEDGTGTGSYSSIIEGLEERTTYYARAYVTFDEGEVYANNLSFKTLRDTTGALIDARDGNIYKMVTIGDQVWMAENLRYLPSVFPPDSFSTTDKQYRYYVYGYEGTDVDEAKETENYDTYGVLYNWDATVRGQSFNILEPPYEIQGVCPAGWHVPSDEEWGDMLYYLGGWWMAGKKLKEAGTSHWGQFNTEATNETGFTALPGGYIGSYNQFYGIGSEAAWWTTTRFSQGSAYLRMMNNKEDNVYQSCFATYQAVSVRCVKDRDE